MADALKGGNQPQLGPPEPHMDKRMIVAFLLMAIVMFGMPYFYKMFAPPPPPPKQAQTGQPATPAPETATPEAETATPAAGTKPAAVKAPAPPAAPIAALEEQSSILQTDLYKIVFSNRGAVVRSWVLKKFKDTAGQPLDLVHQPGALKAGFPFSLLFIDKKPSLDVNQALYAVKTSPDGLGVDYEFSNGAAVVRKSFRFEKSNYLTEVAVEASENGVALRPLAAWRGGFGDTAAQSGATQERSVYFDPVSKRPVFKTASDAKKGPVTDWGDFTFAGIEDKYFAAVFLPRNGGAIALETLSDEVGGVQWVGAAAGGNAVNRFSLFAGPKDLATLKKVDPRLEELVDFGKWFGLLAKPLFLILNWLNDNYVHNYGWAIVLITILINTALLPLRLKSMKSMKKMQALKPQIDIINAKYKNVGLRDPRKQDQNAEVMDLYKKHGVNPMGGCLPMLLQFPFFIAFYTVLTVAIQMRGASWLWVTDLSEPERLPIHILPVLMIVAQFFQQRMTPTPGQDPTQAKMMMLMPLVMGVFFYNMSSGLVLYWLTSNVVGIAQQWFINRTMPAPAEPAVAAAGKPRKGGR